MMKKLFLTSILGALLACTASFAQGYKIGYANVEFVLAKLPEMKTIQSQLQVETKQLEKALIQKQQEFQQKYAAYEQGAAMMDPVTRADKERELQDLQSRLQKMQQDSQAALQKKEFSLTQPLFKKVSNAIEAVAKAKGYKFILSSTTLTSGDNIVLYADDSDNVTLDVLKKLGVTLSAEELAKLK